MPTLAWPGQNGGMRGANGPFQPDGAYVYDANDRRDQLARFASACRRIAAALNEGDWPGASDYYDLATRAAGQLDDSPAAEQLKAIASALPPKPPWMDPRMPDFNGPRSPWRETASLARHDADRTALEMRAWGTYEPPELDRSDAPTNAANESQVGDRPGGPPS